MTLSAQKAIDDVIISIRMLEYIIVSNLKAITLEMKIKESVRTPDCPHQAVTGQKSRRKRTLGITILLALERSRTGHAEVSVIRWSSHWAKSTCKFSTRKITDRLKAGLGHSHLLWRKLLSRVKGHVNFSCHQFMSCDQSFEKLPICNSAMVRNYRFGNNQIKRSEIQLFKNDLYLFWYHPQGHISMHISANGHC